MQNEILQEMTELVAACYKFSDVPSKLEVQCKKGV